MAPSQQKASILSSPNTNSFEIKSKSVPSPGKGQLLVKVEATGLNPIDYKLARFDFFGLKYPLVLGSDVAGIVEEIGEGVADFEKGDKVVFVGSFGYDTSGFQQYALATAEIAAKLPSNVSTDSAASIPIGLQTAATALYQEFPGFPKRTPAWEPNGSKQAAGEPIVIIGGSGSVGQYAIQLAKLSGFSPIITTASPHNFDFLKSLGATHTVDRSAPLSSIADLTEKPIKTIFDTIAIDTQAPAWELLADGGLLVLTLAPTVDKAKYPNKSTSAVQGEVLSPAKRPLGISLYKALPGLLADGSVKTNPIEIIPEGLAGLPNALQRLEQGKVSGKKLVVHPQETL